MSREIYKDTDLKVQIAISAEGFNQATDNYDMDVYCGTYENTFDQSDMRGDGAGHWFLPIPTEDMSPGILYVVVTAYIPDADYPGGIRRETFKPIKIGPVKEKKP